MNKQFKSLPLSEDKYDKIKKKQIELTNRRKRIVPLVEIGDMLVDNGLNALE